MNQDNFTQFLDQFLSKLEPLEKESAIAYFNATISGKPEDYQKSAKLSIELTKLFSNKDDFAKLKAIKESGTVTDPILQRELDELYRAFLGHQISEEKIEAIEKLQTEVEQKFNTFRVTIGDKKITDNEVDEILANSENSGEIKAAWLGSKEIGKLVAPDVIKLVKMRNEAARELGFSNYHEMSLKLSEQDPAEIEQIFDDLNAQTENTYNALKAEIDKALAKKFDINASELQPWHYGDRFFQEVPKIYELNLDKYYKNRNVVELVQQYYASIGLPIEHLIKQSDLYEKKDKYQHAYCISVDRSGDVRVVANVKDNERWMGTLLHEYGHALYDDKVDRSLPWLLRSPSHIFTTEAIAMLFGRLVYSPDWYKRFLGVSDDEAAAIGEHGLKYLQMNELIFSRFAEVMLRFEKSMYENPDQDLNGLWWKLVERYQKLVPPADQSNPDWASKIHIAHSPAYYHNYLLGSLLASQLTEYIARNITGTNNLADSFYNKLEVGEYLSSRFFAPGDRFSWNEHIKLATGEPLSSDAFARQFIGYES